MGFEIDGTASDQIVVRGLAFIDESTLMATVDVTGDALETFYDVAIRNGPKKKGIGIDLLEVVPPFVVPIIEGTVIGGSAKPWYAGHPIYPWRR